MNYINRIFLFYSFSRILFKGIQSERLSTSSIKLVARYSDHSIVLICDVQGNAANKWNIYLACPFISGRVCYINCKSNCHSPNDCLPMLTSCSIENINNDHIRLKWTVDVTYANLSGEWQCSQRGNSSNSISLENSRPKFIVTKHIPNVKNITATAPPDVVTLYPPIEMEIPKAVDKKLYYHHYGNDFWQLITQPNIVLILVCVFTVSLLLNIVFLIRCALFRSLIDNYLQAKKSPNSCLYRFFCISVNPNLPNDAMKGINDHKTSTYNGYNREGIYDDMSSGSQTNRHFINTLSTCELEHDTLLTRKICNPDGSYPSMNRQSHVCPDQEIANYVYVTGPRCSNRNYVPLNTHSNSSVASKSQHTYTTDMIGRSPSNEFQRPEYFTVSENVIYSQPAKNRIQCLDPTMHDNIPYTYMSNFTPVYPPVPQPPSPTLIRRCSKEETRQYSLSTEPTPPKTMDLIEHYTISTTPQLAE